jgi:hypothetical protein
MIEYRMSVIPPNLNEIYQNLGAFRKSLIRFYPDRTGTINAGDVLRWTLPKEILTMDTLMHYFEITTTRAGTNGTNEIRSTHFPRNSASIIDTISVFINGQVFENIQSYNHLFNLIYDNTSGFNYYQSGIRALECADPSIKYSVADASGNAITATVSGANITATVESNVCENRRPLQIRNWIGFLGTCQRILDLTNVEVVIEIRYASAQILFAGLQVGGTPVAVTPTYTLPNFYMTIFKLNFDDDYYQMALNSLKASGNYSIVFKTYNSARSAQVDKSTNPNLQFSTTAKYLSKCYFTMLNGTFDTLDIIQNTTSNVSFSEVMANLRTNRDAFNQSRFFAKNAVSLTEAQVEINGIPVYPFPQPLHLIKNNNFEAFGIEDDRLVGDFPGLQSLESWTKYGFLMATSFEFPKAWKNGIVSGYPNPTGNLLTINFRTTFTSATDKVYLLAYAERIVRANFNGSAVSIDY